MSERLDKNQNYENLPQPEHIAPESAGHMPISANNPYDAETVVQPQKQIQEKNIALPGIKIALTSFRLARAESLIEKLKIKESVASTNARRSLGYDANPERKSPYDIIEHDEKGNPKLDNEGLPEAGYIPPVNAGERFMAKRRKNHAKKMRRKEYKRRHLEETYGGQIAQKVPNRKTRLQDGERITRSEHRNQVKASNEHRRLKHGREINGVNVGGSDKKKENLQKVVDRDNQVARLRQRRIASAERRSSALSERRAELENAKGPTQRLYEKTNEKKQKFSTVKEKRHERRDVEKLEQEVSKLEAEKTRLEQALGIDAKNLPRESAEVTHEKPAQKNAQTETVAIDSTAEKEHKRGLKVGDSVIWESQGTVMMKEPVKIQSIHEDPETGRKYAFIEGSSTGLPLDELLSAEEQ